LGNALLVALLDSVATLFSGRRWPWTLVAASVGTCLTTLVFFVFYRSRKMPGNNKPAADVTVATTARAKDSR